MTTRKQGPPRKKTGTASATSATKKASTAKKTGAAKKTGTAKKRAPMTAAASGVPGVADVLEQWLSRQDPNVVSVTRGSAVAADALDAAERAMDVKLTKEARAVIERFGWLEFSVSPALWPHLMFVDGLRIFGFGDAPDRLSLVKQRERLQAIVAERTARDPKAHFDFNRTDSVRASVPVVSTLEGLKNAWLSRRDLAWFNDLTTRYEQSIIRVQSDARQQSPLFKAKRLGELLPLLLERLDWRIERARHLRALHDALSSIGPCRVGGDQKLRLVDRPEVAFHVGRFAGHAVIRAERLLGLTDATFLDLNAAAAFARFEHRDYDSDGSKWNVAGCVDLLPGTRLDASRVEWLFDVLEHARVVARGGAVTAEIEALSKDTAALVRQAFGETARADLMGGRFRRLRVEVPVEGRGWGATFGMVWRPINGALIAELPLAGEKTNPELSVLLPQLPRYLSASADDDRWIADC